MAMMDLHAKPRDDGGSSPHHFYPIGLPHDFPFLDDQTHIMHLKFLPPFLPLFFLFCYHALDLVRVLSSSL